MHFLKMCRSELDRLIEQAPVIPDNVIEACRKEFMQYPKVRKPEIVGDINTTNVFVDTNSRLKEMAKEAAITIAQKKGVLKQIVLDDLEPRISRVIEHSTLPAIRDELKQEIRDQIERVIYHTVDSTATRKGQSPQDTIISEMKRRLATAATKYETPLPGGTAPEEVIVHLQEEEREDDTSTIHDEEDEEEERVRQAQ